MAETNDAIASVLYKVKTGELSEKEGQALLLSLMKREVLDERNRASVPAGGCHY